MTKGSYTSDTSGLCTFAVVHPCRSIRSIDHQDQIEMVLSEAYKPLIVGGGSNILFTQPIERDIVVINHEGVEIIREDQHSILVEVQSGTSWHELVTWAVENNYGGIENLSLIPGKCGAAPMQNIGAYGVEIKDVFEYLKAYDLKDQKTITLSNSECQFGYRDSIFKGALKDRVVITSIVLRLAKADFHQINTSYGAIELQLREMGIHECPSIAHVSQAVIAIRESKLPDPRILPNAGSFFKNPIIDRSRYDQLLSRFPLMPSYQVNDKLVKVPAGWLIDQCGWKGKQIGQVATYKNQALVIVNHGTHNGQDIVDYSKLIQKSVFDTYGIEIIPEVNIY